MSAEAVRRANAEALEASWMVAAVANSGIGAVEVISDPGKDGRVFFMSDTGHTPSRYELGQMEPADWESLASAVAALGSPAFAGRLALLERVRDELEARPAAR